MNTRYAPHHWVNPRDRSESKDCTVRAICIAAGIRYADAHACCELAGRKLNRVFFSQKGLNVAKTLGLLDYDVVPPLQGTYTLSEVLKLYNRGRYVVEGRHHAFALIDGVVHDMANYNIGLNTKIESVWRIK